MRVRCVPGRWPRRGRSSCAASSTRDRLTAIALVGAGLGSGGGFERLHFLLASAFTEPERTELSPVFLEGVDESLPFGANPIYALLHESCYTRGPATNWAAERIRAEHFASQFDAEVSRLPKFAAFLLLLLFGPL